LRAANPLPAAALRRPRYMARHMRHMGFMRGTWRRPRYMAANLLRACD
jgi:hypothetical protein